MSKEVGRVVVISSEQYVRKDNTFGYRVVGMTEEKQPVVFFRDGSDGEPINGDNYIMLLGFDRSLKAIIRYQRI